MLLTCMTEGIQGHPPCPQMVDDAHHVGLVNCPDCHKFFMAMAVYLSSQPAVIGLALSSQPILLANLSKSRPL